MKIITEENREAEKAEEDIRRLFAQSGLGELCGVPCPVSGGLMHRMYRVCAQSGIYAVKWLNPVIMQRRDALHNMILSERISHAFAKVLPVSAAEEIGGEHVLCLDGKYFMIFKWVEGKSLLPPEPDVEKCGKIGAALGIMHRMDLSIEGAERPEKEEAAYDWESYVRLGREQNAPWADACGAALDKLKAWSASVRDSAALLSENMVISHCDLDPKNVLWKDGQPCLIDWEAAGYVNPYRELLDVLFYWSDDGAGGLDRDKFSGLLRAYGEYMELEEIPWKILFQCGCSNMLGWLDYNLRRALGMECADEQERLLGEAQAALTLRELEQYEKKSGQAADWVT